MNNATTLPVIAALLLATNGCMVGPKYQRPLAIRAEPADAPPNTLGMRSVMFEVDDVDEALARLQSKGAELIGEVAQYEDSYRLCYVRGPEGIIIGLAEQLS